MGKYLFFSAISASAGRDPHILAKHSSELEKEEEEKIKLKGGRTRYYMYFFRLDSTVLLDFHRQSSKVNPINFLSCITQSHGLFSLQIALQQGNLPTNQPAQLASFESV